MAPDPETTNIIYRPEYEARHATIEGSIQRLDSKIESLISTGTITWNARFSQNDQEHDQIRKDMQDKFDTLVGKIDGLRGEVRDRENSNLKWVLSSIVSFIIGTGGLLGLLEALHLLK